MHMIKITKQKPSRDSSAILVKGRSLRHPAYSFKAKILPEELWGDEVAINGGRIWHVELFKDGCHFCEIPDYTQTRPDDLWEPVSAEAAQILEDIDRYFPPSPEERAAYHEQAWEITEAVFEFVRRTYPDVPDRVVADGVHSVLSRLL